MNDVEFEGFVIHHTACGSGGDEQWDFMIRKDGTVSASPVLRNSQSIHICLEGDFNQEYEMMNALQKIQLFSASKIIIELSKRYDISPLYLFPHSETCPGQHFPWKSLVIYPVDGYH